MACYHPMTLYRRENGTVRGYGPWVDAEDLGPMSVPCGGCFGCMIERSKAWTMRCRHESQFWENNIFVTLTYDEKHYPPDGSLNRVHLQKFVRALRKKVKCGVEFAPGEKSRPVRYFACGEYGEKTKRAHYHVLLFNLWLKDSVKFGKDTWTSPTLSSVWTYGTHLIAPFTPASAAYVAGYATKKVVGRLEREAAYESVDVTTGEVTQVVPDFNLMSLKPGIGQYWYDRYKRDLLKGYVMLDGQKCMIPRFYMDQLRRDFPLHAEEIDMRWQAIAAERDPAEKSEQRREVKQLVAMARKRFYKRETLMEG